MAPGAPKLAFIAKPQIIGGTTQSEPSVNQSLKLKDKVAIDQRDSFTW